MKVALVFGTRPEAIKMAPLVKAFQSDPSMETLVCVTGQHRLMLDQVLTLFDIVPDIDLNLMRPGQTLSDITAGVLHGVGRTITDHRPDLVLVHGDTTSAMAAAMAAFYHQIPVGHVEAGLRTGDIWRPWPEEMNRRFVDSVAHWMFAPTEGARQCLLDENVNPSAVTVTGNTVIDALVMAKNIIKTRPDLAIEFQEQFSFLEPAKRLILVTGHRRENFGGGLANMCAALATIARRGDVQIVYPVHLNENVQSAAKAALSGVSNVFLVKPQDYLPFIYLMERSHFVITDSGGIQEEAPGLGKPVLVTRDVTERPEAIAAGTARLVGTEPDRIIAEASNLLDNDNEYERVSKIRNPYGDGAASGKILKVIQHAL
jgi:UDP-N-acetylglucosamine 2-epimerase